MAASRPENDYVHILTKDIVQAAGGTPTIMATYNAQFEWNYNTTYDWSSLQPQLDFTPDIVIVAIGENLAPLGTEQSKNEFAVAFARLLAQFKSNGNPAIVVRSSFIADPTFGVMRHVADTAGAVYVEQTWIGNDAHNHAYSEPYYAHNNAFNGHPGNQGMAVIAKSLYSSIVAYSLAVPETDHCCVSACRRRLPAFRWRRRNAVGLRLARPRETWKIWGTLPVSVNLHETGNASPDYNVGSPSKSQIDGAPAFREHFAGYVRREGFRLRSPKRGVAGPPLVRRVDRAGRVAGLWAAVAAGLHPLLEKLGPDRRAPKPEVGGLSLAARRSGAALLESGPILRRSR